MYKTFVTILILLSFIVVTYAKTITYNWSIGWVTAAPDGFTRQVIGINGKFPLPTVEGNVGDKIIISVYNNLGDESTSIHFHGLDQLGSQFADGPSGVTQCPIPPRGSLVYDFVLVRPGNYWYHSHNKGQYPDGLRGPLIVHDTNDPYAGQYDEEIVLTMSDWYHEKVPGLISTMLSKSNPRAQPPFPNALLLNETTSATFNFVTGKTYKIKMINMAAFASVFIQFDNHPMNIIEIDGSYTVKKEAYQLRLSPAQRYTVLLKAQSSTRRNYAFLASLDQNRDFSNENVAAVWPLNITGNIVYDYTKALAPAMVVPKWKPFDDATLEALDGQALLGPREKADKEITLNFNFGLDASGIPRSYFNNLTYIPQKVPTLFSAISTGISNINPSIYGAVNPFVIKRGDIVQITVNNLDGAIHPFHLHGHQFQVVERPSSGKGKYTGKGRDFPVIPPKRDTYAVQANSYAVIRFQADNPGVWLFHCHIEWHVIMGLTATIIEAPELLRDLSLPPDHKANCDAQGVPTKGNAAGNTRNFTDMAGAYTLPEFPDKGAAYPKRMVKASKAFGRILPLPKRIEADFPPEPKSVASDTVADSLRRRPSPANYINACLREERRRPGVRISDIGIKAWQQLDDPYVRSPPLPIVIPKQYGT
ncbi:related to Conidial Pigment Biosynthesis protein brown1 [Rhynchosporium graminicola]|uniref:Related to Conidial Pigment Biosynthesis protein brown1 n=1 Tax=Rhynchosporium graminicola TaxID=2792576 RepID=A0A1E1KY50_9HELO|nr:related to Conidial Pigment Biosynthesis protein brown1 [Rhynchosporium commune]